MCGFPDASFAVKSKMKLNDVMKFINLPLGLEVFIVLSLIYEVFITDCINISTLGRTLSKTGCRRLKSVFFIEFQTLAQKVSKTVRN